MPLWELTNPSDQVVFEAADITIATIVTFELGGGNYGATSTENTEKVPIFLFGGAQEWVQKRFGCGYAELVQRAMKEQGRDLQLAFESLFYGPTDQYRLFREAKGDRWREHIHEWNEQHRSSMNNIGARARSLAVAVSKRVQEDTAA